MRCALFVVCCLLVLGVRCFELFVVCCLLIVVCCLLFVVCRLLFVGRGSPLAVYCLLKMCVMCSLSVVRCSL